MKTTEEMKMGTKSIGSVAAAAVALAFGAILFAAPHAEAMPPRNTSDRLAENCTNDGGTFAVAQGQFKPRDRYYSCTLPVGSDGWQDQVWWTSTGGAGQICHRFGVDTDWICF